MTVLPLEGQRIIDLGTAWAGPMVSTVLCDMGAEVIKVETHGKLDGLRLGRPIVGDDVAGGDQGKWPDMQPVFHGVNRGKLSITLNLKKPEGVEVLKRLVEISDVVVDNFSPAALAGFGLEYAQLRQVNPRIICISLTGLGSYGPEKDIVAYAATTLVLSGLAGFIGYYGEEPLHAMEVPYTDISAATLGAFAVLAALYRRNRTGEGQYIDLSETEAVLPFMGEAIMGHVMDKRSGRTDGHRPPRGNRHPYMAPHDNYRCQGEDRWVSIAVETQQEWEKFARAIGSPAWTGDERFSTLPGRIGNRDELDRLVASWTVGQRPDAATGILQRAGVAAMTVMNCEDQFVDAQYRERHTYPSLVHPLVGEEVIFRTPWSLSETPGAIRGPAPSLGQHNEYVFGKLLGMDSTTTARLAQEGVIC